jgi:DNA-binding phage protein
MTTEKKERTFATYKSYSFKDKDPVIDQLRTILADEGESYADVSLMSGVSTATLYNWFSGATKRPQFATVMAVTRSLGYDMQITKRRVSSTGSNVVRLVRPPRRSAAERAA